MSIRECARRVPCDGGYVSKLATSTKRPSPEMAERFDQVLGAGGALAALAVDSANGRDVLKIGLAAAVTPEALQAVLAGAAVEALEFTRQAGATAVGQRVLDHLDAVIAGLDRSYCVQPPAEVFPIARAYHARVADLMAGPCTLRERRELYVFGGWLSELLAWLSHDLGGALAAEAFAVDSFEHADQAGHGELCGWAADALASVAWYTGRPAGLGRRAKAGAAAALMRRQPFPPRPGGGRSLTATAAHHAPARVPPGEPGRVLVTGPVSLGPTVTRPGRAGAPA